MRWGALFASTGATLAALAGPPAFNAGLTAVDTGRLGAQINAPSPTATSGVRVVVIDAGHGGRDHGCHGTTHGAREKHVALALALALGERLATRHPELRVVYTRQTDVFVPLHERAAVANAAQADLFISLHCNALPGLARVRGSETYVMGLHTAQHNLDVAKRENAAIHLERDAGHHYDFDPDSPAGHITLSMFQHAFLEQSLRLAADLETALGARDGQRSRGVKQAGFLVLRETAMPSVLVETGYLTNAAEEAYLDSEAGRAETVAALYEGVAAYMRHRSRERLSASTPGEAPARPVSVRASHASAEASTTEAQLRDLSEPASPIVAPVGRPSRVRAPAPPSSGVAFYIQLAASRQPLQTGGGRWATLAGPLRSLREGDYHKYQVGPYATLSEAEAIKRVVRRGGFPEAFTVGYRGVERVSGRELSALR